MTGAAGDAMPHLIAPMQPSAGSGEPPTGPDWRVEVAWTGHRCIAYVHPSGPGHQGKVRLLSGADNSMTHAYPEFAAPLLARCPPGGMVLDGTIVARGEEHAPRARLLKRRHSRYKPSEQDIAAIPVDYQVADLLFFDGHPTTELPYRDRRGLLEGLGLASAPVWTTALFPATELDSIMRIAAAEGVDAFHARHLGARYRPGGRSKFWVRVPVARTRQVVVGGWTPTDPQRPDTIATLLLGVPAPAGLRYVGRVGVGVEARRVLDGDLRGAAVDRSPFTTDLPAEAARHAVWVEPDLVGLVEFAGWVGGARMRLPRWRGLAEYAAIDDAQYAVPPLPDTAPEEPPVGSPAPPPAPDPVEARRLDQHFVYNSLNTIAALIRTDPSRARELLFGYADLSRTVDGPPETTLGRELDAVRAYLQLEQARFGRRLQVQIDVADGVDGVPVAAMRVFNAVREAVQRDLEPRTEGGLLTLTVFPSAEGHEVTVIAAGETRRIVFPPD